ncbi:MAG: hypothetical protein D0530_01085 [Methylococcales bacterium]|jgi:hypothetical protein|nr:MAG: hypothetical protein D0530_01085 [Methylococcales bacterium]
MTLRTIISCDRCNLRRLKSIEFRRGIREGSRTGRRLSDGRSWIEADDDYAIRNGWLFSSDGQHICPSCQAENADLVKTYDTMIYK